MHIHLSPFHHPKSEIVFLVARNPTLLAGGGEERGWETSVQKHVATALSLVTCEDNHADACLHLIWVLQGYLAHKKLPPSRTLQ